MNIICGSDTDGRCIDNEGNLILDKVLLNDSSLGTGSSINNKTGAILEVKGEVKVE